MSQAWIEGFLSDKRALKEQEERLKDRELWAILFLEVGHGTPEPGPRKVRVVEVDGKKLLEIEPGLSVSVPVKPIASKRPWDGLEKITKILVRRKLAVDVKQARAMVCERRVAVVERRVRRRNGQFAGGVRSATIVGSHAARFLPNTRVIVKLKDRKLRRRSQELRGTFRRLGTTNA